ncbi:MAG: ABC transporter ATP-binding protein [Steroidobacteraceae bacterium]
MSDFVRVHGLCIDVLAGAQSTRIVSDVGFSIARGEVLALIGESGSGKTSVALALMGYARGNCRITSGRVQIGELDVLALTRRELQVLRGAQVSYVAQSAAAAFNPSRTIIEQVMEPALLRHAGSRVELRKKAIELFRALALPDPQAIGDRYPHEVSGGQLQRAMAAMALITDPWLVIFDEPTTALDVTTQVEVLRAFKRTIRESGITALYVSHDLAVVAQMADHIVVLKQGTVREASRTAQILANPTDDYTRELLAAADPARIEARIHGVASRPEPAMPTPLLRCRGLGAGYRDRPVLRDVTFDLGVRQTVGVVGESGSGKSTLARVIAGLLPQQSGSVEFEGETLPADVGARSPEQLRRIQLVFQNADTSLNPAHSVRRILLRPLLKYGQQSRSAADAQLHRLLDLVRLPSTVINRTTAGLSGGQKQRVSLARALAAEPRLILCDEVTASLDTIVAAAMLELFATLQKELQLSYLFISHDISTVRAICDQVLVLRAGAIVERGAAQSLLGAPAHEYTQLLCASVPPLRPGWLETVPLGAAPAGIA